MAVCFDRKDYIDKGILQTVDSGIPLCLGHESQNVGLGSLWGPLLSSNPEYVATQSSSVVGAWLGEKGASDCPYLEDLHSNPANSATYHSLLTWTSQVPQILSLLPGIFGINAIMLGTLEVQEVTLEVQEVPRYFVLEWMADNLAVQLKVTKYDVGSENEEKPG